MEELCDALEYTIPIHDPYSEGEKLNYSIKTPLDLLVKNITFINNSRYRYQKYIKYTNVLTRGDSGAMIGLLVDDFYKTDPNDILLLAVKMKVIDTLIYDLLK